MDTIEGKARWIHCTPLTGSDGRVGVIMIIMVDKQDVTHNPPDLNRVPSTRPVGSEVGGHTSSHTRARSHNSFRSAREPDYTPEHRHPHSTPSSTARNSTSPPRAGAIDNPPPRPTVVSRLYADYMKEVRETQKKLDPFSTRTRDSLEQSSGSRAPITATAVAVRAVHGKGRAKKIGGTF